MIVKNLPPKTTEKALSDMFSQCGQVTDAKLIRTRTGFLRGFGFVGLVSDMQAKQAVEMFDRSFIGASRITVEVAKPYGDESLERPWSKYSKGSSAFEKRDRERKMTERQQVGKERDIEKKKKLSVLPEIEENEKEEFQEFLAVHTHKSQVQTWADGETKQHNKGVKRKQKVKEEEEEEHEVKKHKRTKLKVKEKRARNHPKTFAGSAGDSESENEDEKEMEEEKMKDERSCEDRIMADGGSDMDYLRSKVVTNLKREEEGSSSDDEEMVVEGDRETTQSENGDESDETSKSCDSEHEEASTKQGGNEFSSTMYTLRMRGLPFKATLEDVEAFFHPTTLADVRFTVDKDGRPSGRAYVDFNSEEEMMEAMKMNGDCIGKRYIELFPDEGPQSAKVDHTESNQRRDFVAMANKDIEREETIADCGRLFLRNLSYTVTEEDLTETFEKFGPLTEVTIPLDKNTNRPTGLGFITYMLPEHAVMAYDSLDGQVFQGRLLHILPARPRQGRHTNGDGDSTPAGSSTSSFKQKRESERKSQAGSSHNWNTLFLGSNAVVDAMAQRYSTEKSHILDPESDQSVAVRMALGETQLVSETREFLEAHGVQLDIFEQKRPKRSSTVILVKNLPHGTKQSELQDLFSSFGSLHRVILPPSGISSLVEFLEPSHAKSAFKKLAYSKFKHLPLYLEWAPQGAVGKTEKRKVTEEGVVEIDADEKSKVGEKEEERELSSGEQCTLFVKNLNFSTDEESLKKIFSRIGGVRKAEIARKRNMKDPSHPLSMGFGFVEFTTPQMTLQALKDLQHTELEGHRLELKLSHRTVPEKSDRKTAEKKEQKSAKIMVRNIPFEATQKEVRELFQTFGQLKTVRLPKKMAAVGKHRGFGFVEFMTEEDAKRAFESLCHSTHLYGRRLVLEWAEAEDSVEDIRKRTAEHFHGFSGAVSSKRRKAELLLYGSNKDDQ